MPTAPCHHHDQLENVHSFKKPESPPDSEPFSHWFLAPDPLPEESPTCEGPPGSRKRAAVASATLDPLESAVDQKYISPSDENWVPPVGYATCFRHNGWEPRRRYLFRILYSAFGASSMTAAYSRCGSDHWVLKDRKDPSNMKIVESCCKTRFCVPCFNAKCAQVRARLAAELGDEPCRLITLTLKPTHTTLKESLDHLYRSFRRLRQSLLWRKRVLGGVAFLEVKRGKGSGLWHPHLHIVTRGRYILGADLSRQWLIATGDSHNVDIRFIKSRPHVIAYVTKYLTKQVDLSARGKIEDGDDPGQLDFYSIREVVIALRGRRTIIAFGTFRHFKLLATAGDSEWELVASWAEVQFRAYLDEPWAVSIVDAVLHLGADDVEFTSDVPPP